MSEARYWVSRNGGTPEGPYWPGRLRQMYDSGKVAADDQVCEDGTDAWTDAETVMEFVKARSANPLLPASPVLKIVTTETSTPGIILIVAGLLTSWFFCIGLIFIIWGCIILRKKIYSCGKCGNNCGDQAKICGVCGARLL